MPNFSKSEIVLVRYPFSDLTGTKVRPAVVVNAWHVSHDLLLVPLTSNVSGLLAGEFVLADWKNAGLHIETAVKRGIYTIIDTLVIKSIGKMKQSDAEQLDQSLYGWLGLVNHGSKI